MEAQVAKIAQVVGENQNFEGLKNAIQILIFVCRYMFLFLFAAILQKCASGSSGKHNFANCIFDASSHQVPSGISFLPLARQPLVFFENHKNQVADRFGAAGRNAQGRWGEI